jgi:hypothetical protein
MTQEVPFAAAGSQCWLQVGVARGSSVLERAFYDAGAISQGERLEWCSPIPAMQFRELRDREAYAAIGITEFPVRPLSQFWPRFGPVWDGLAVTDQGHMILIEAKAHVAEVLSPPSRAGVKSKALITASLAEAQKFYAPRSRVVWGDQFYQYINRLAHLYFLRDVNRLPARLVFLDFYNAREMNGPTSAEEWAGVTKLMHAMLGLPHSLQAAGVFHAYVDVAELERLL